ITGNVATSLIGKDSFQEVDITGVTMPITKHNYIVKNVDRLADLVKEAFVIANTGRPGPVLIDIPKDIQMAVTEYNPAPIEKQGKVYNNGKEAFIKALDIIEKSKKPFIYAGGGVVISDASEELALFAERIDAPIGSSMMGLSAIDADNPRFLGMTGMHGRFAASKVMSESDLIIAIGTRFSDRATGNKKEFCKGRKIIHIDIDPAEIGKNVPVYVSLIGDVKTILRKLLERVTELSKPDWRKKVEEIKNCPDSHLEMDKSRLNPQTIIESVNKITDKDTLIATDVGQHQMWTAQYYKFAKPRTFITSGGLGTMGFGLGAAVGACIGTGRKTVLFTSDGCFHMNMNELCTAVTYKLPIVIVLFNNNALGMVRQWQTLFFEKRYSNTTLNRKTNYIALAEAFGAKAKKITDINEIDDTLKWAFSQQGPVLIEAVIDSDEKVLPMIPPGGTINDIILKG
ncbi:MAG: biosynthetic-type acetolactate synthase large subunit, partial [Christensenellales bacterium]